MIVRRVIFGAAKVVVLAAVLAVGCDQMGVEVVKILPEPPLRTTPAKQTPSKIRQPTKVAGKRTQSNLGWVPAGWIPPGGISKRWQCIVIHHSASSAGCAGDFHTAHLQRGWDELGYHFVIGNGTGSGNGQIEIGSRWFKQKHGAHCRTTGNYHNEHGIGICMVGNFDRGTPTAAQQASVRKLVRFLMAKCGVSAVRVIGHREAPGAHTRCPGSNVQMPRFRTVLDRYARADGS